MNLSRNQIIIIAAVGLVVLFFVLVFLCVIPGLKSSCGNPNPSGTTQVSLSFWGVDNANFIQPVIDEYSKANKNVAITYRQFDNPDVYEKALLNALAINQGPDILMLNNAWLPKYYDKITPAPETFFSLNQLQQSFPVVVEQDFVLRQAQDKSLVKIYSLPLYIDTLVLLYNKDIFDAKAIALAPTTWLEFQNLIPRLRQSNSFNQIIKSAASIGGSNKNIDSASDLLALLMKQFGSEMNDTNNRVSFGKNGLSALNFYLQFANPSSPYYTWSENFPYSLNGLSNGSTAIIFNYASQIPLIKNKNPYLRLGITPMLQFYNNSQPINYANYWGLTAAKQSKNSGWAWHFIVSIATNPQIAEVYLQASKRPPALRTLIEKYKNDPDLGVFSQQALTARSWQQPDSAVVKQTFSDMIESVLNGRLNSNDALSQAENAINNLTQ